ELGERLFLLVEDPRDDGGALRTGGDAVGAAAQGLHVAHRAQEEVRLVVRWRLWRGRCGRGWCRRGARGRLGEAEVTEGVVEGLLLGHGAPLTPTARRPWDRELPPPRSPGAAAGRRRSGRTRPRPPDRSRTGSWRNPRPGEGPSG